MKKIVLVTMTALAAAAICTGGAAATDTRTLSQFLLACGRDARTCELNLEDYLRAARDQNLVCLPQDASLAKSVRQELSWMRRQRDADPTLNDGNIEDVQWTAITTLWPCKKDEGPPP